MLDLIVVVVTISSPAQSLDPLPMTLSSRFHGASCLYLDERGRGASWVVARNPAGRTFE